MTMHVRDAATWKQVTSLSVKDASTWKSVIAGYVRDAGTWKAFHSVSNFARPDADIATGNWGSGGSLWDKLDEVTPSDADAVDSATLTDAAPTDEFTVALSDVADPGVDTGHVIRARLKWSSDAVAGTLTVLLMQGATGIAELATAGSTSYTTYTLVLTTAQAANITNYADLRLRVTASKDDIGGTLVASCSWLEFEIP